MHSSAVASVKKQQTANMLLRKLILNAADAGSRSHSLVQVSFEQFSWAVRIASAVQILWAKKKKKMRRCFEAVLSSPKCLIKEAYYAYSLSEKT